MVLHNSFGQLIILFEITYGKAINSTNIQKIYLLRFVVDFFTLCIFFFFLTSLSLEISFLEIDKPGAIMVRSIGIGLLPPPPPPHTHTLFFGFSLFIITVKKLTIIQMLTTDLFLYRLPCVVILWFYITDTKFCLFIIIVKNRICVFK